VSGPRVRVGGFQTLDFVQRPDESPTPRTPAMPGLKTRAYGFGTASRAAYARRGRGARGEGEDRWGLLSAAPRPPAKP